MKKKPDFSLGAPSQLSFSLNHRTPRFFLSYAPGWGIEAHLEGLKTIQLNNTMKPKYELIVGFLNRKLPDMESWLAKIASSKDVTDPFVDVHLGK